MLMMLLMCSAALAGCLESDNDNVESSEDLPSTSDTIENNTVEEDDLEIPAFLRRQKN